MIIQYSLSPLYCEWRNKRLQYADVHVQQNAERGGHIENSFRWSQLILYGVGSLWCFSIHLWQGHLVLMCRGGAADHILRWGYKTGFASGASEKIVKLYPNFSKCLGTSKQISVGACWIHWNLLSGCRINIIKATFNICNRPLLIYVWL